MVTTSPSAFAQTASTCLHLTVKESMFAHKHTLYCTGSAGPWMNIDSGQANIAAAAVLLLLEF